jgi:hypothetical protein
MSIEGETDVYRERETERERVTTAAERIALPGGQGTLTMSFYYSAFLSASLDVRN